MVSLHTQALHEAQQRRWPLYNEWQQRFERARTGAPLALPEIDAVARETYAAVLAAMEANAKQRRPLNVLIAGEEAVELGLPKDCKPSRQAAAETNSAPRRRHSPDAFLSGAVEFMRAEIARHGGLEPFLSQAGDFEQYGVAPDIARIEARTGLSLDRSSETYRTLCQAILRARIAAADGRLRALQGGPSEPQLRFFRASCRTTRA